jgi:hypothetical protein
MWVMLTVGCLYHWIKSRKLEINLYFIEDGLVELTYTKLYITIENVLLCANTTPYGKKCKKVIGRQLYHMFSKPLAHVKLFPVLAKTCTHIVHRMYCKVLHTKVPRNTTYSVYCNRFVHVNITLTHTRSTAYP